MIAPLHIINSFAPIRVCDIGGWTDTWFAERGAVFNIGVQPFVQAQVFVYHAADRKDRITVFAENYGESFVVNNPPLLLSDKHALLEAAFVVMRVPDDLAIEVHLFSEVPAGASTGTSAAVSVALIGALDTLTPGSLSPYEVAQTAQRIETEVLSLQCGIQDQLCSAYGGVNYIQMTRYPHASVSPLLLPNEILWELERRLMLVYLGSAHVSSDVHKLVIKELEARGPADARLEGLRGEAARAKNAVLAGDFRLLAEAMRANTDWQGKLHPGILGDKAREVIDLARACNAWGWKLNGAGGNGGSLTLLFGNTNRDKRLFAERLGQEMPAARIIPIHLSQFGLRVWQSQV
ncbi:MAG: GHMP kinase [Verrucomicrobia bacterium]|nr:GHMP kinase [Verrucomicrobiota bacterium]